MTTPFTEKIEIDEQVFESLFQSHLTVTEDDEDETGEWFEEKDPSNESQRERTSIEVFPDESGDDIEEGSSVSDRDWSGGDDDTDSTRWFTGKTGERLNYDIRKLGTDYIAFIKNKDGTWSKASKEQEAVLFSGDPLVRAAHGISDEKRLTEHEKKVAEESKEILRKATEQKETPAVPVSKENPPPASNVITNNTEHIQQRKADVLVNLDSVQPAPVPILPEKDSKPATTGTIPYVQEGGKVHLHETDKHDKPAIPDCPTMPNPEDFGFGEEFNRGAYQDAMGEYWKLLESYEQAKKDASEKGDGTPTVLDEPDTIDNLADMMQETQNLLTELSEIDAVLEANGIIDPERIVPAE